MNRQARADRDRAALVASAKRHRGRLQANEARALTRKNAPSLVLGDKIVPPADAIDSVIGDRAVRLKAEGGRQGQVLISSMPMAELSSGSNKAGTAKYTVADLDWQASGERFTIKRPLSDVSLPKVAGGVVRLEDGTDLRLAPKSADAVGVVSGESVTYPNIAQDTDMTVRSLPAGFGVGWTLRSPDAMHELRVPIGLEDGQRLKKLEDGSIVILDADGEPVRELSPAIAADADQHAVDLATSIDGDTIVYAVDHAEGDVAYPVTVDPYTFPAGGSYSGWRTQNTPNASAPFSYFGDTSPYTSGGQLSIFAPAGGGYHATAAAAWARFSPGNPAYGRPHSGHARWTGFTVGGLSYTWYGQQWYHVYNRPYGKVFVADYKGEIKQVNDVPAGTSGATMTLNPAGAGAATDNQIGFGLTFDGAGATLDRPGAGIFIAWYTATAADDTPPTPTTTYNGQWFDSTATPPAGAPANPQISMNGYDDGLGVQTIELRDSSGALLGTPTTLSCAPQNTQVCPFASPNTTKSVVGATEGRRVARIRVTDAGGSVGEHGFHLNIDNSAPDLQFYGTLFDQRGTAIGATETRNLRIEARDGTYGGTPEQQASGVATLNFYLDGRLVESKPQTLPGDSRGIDLPWTADTSLAPGRHVIRAEATDRLGHTKVAEFEFNRQGPADSVAPNPSITGDVTAIADGVAERGKTYDLSVEADDEGAPSIDNASGVLSSQLLVDGLPRATSPAEDCGTTAPATDCPTVSGFDGTLNFDTLTEGSHQVQARATDGAGNSAVSDAWSVTVDRTAPTANTSVAAVRSTTNGDIDVQWAGDDDLDLPDGTPGAGLARWTYRTRVDAGAWSSWTTSSANAHTTMSGVASSAQQVQVEVRSIDAAGNESPTASLTTNIVAGPTAAGAAARAGSASLTGCGGDFQTPEDELYRKTSLVDFAGERQIAIKVQASITCAPADPLDSESRAAFRAARDSVQLCVQYKRGSDWIDGSCGKPVNIPRRGSVLSANVKTSHKDLCKAGRREYRVFLSTYSRVPGRGETYAENKDRTETLDCNESGAWRRVAARSKGRASEELGNALPEGIPFPGEPGIPLDADPLPPNGTSSRRRGWDAHHVIPAGSRRAAMGRAQAWGYACDVYPNGARNGVWLRGRNLVGGKPAYSNLSTSERRRAAHSQTFSDRYGDWLTSRLGSYINSDGTCANRGGMITELRTLKQDMRAGNY